METMTTEVAHNLITDGFVTKFVTFVNICEKDCYSMDITRDIALAMIERVIALGSDTIHAFYNESTGTLAIG